MYYTNCNKELLKDSRMIIGFINPGGVVGSICVDYVYRQLKMNYIGTIIETESDPLCLMTESKGVMRNVVRIYNKDNLSAIVCDINFLMRSLSYNYKFAEVIVDFAHQCGIKEMVLLDSMKVSNNESTSILTSTKSYEELEFIKNKYNIEIADQIVLSGINAALLNLLHVVDMDNLLVLSTVKNLRNPDIKSYIEVINFISRYLDVHISTCDLEDTYNKFLEELKRREEESRKYLNDMKFMQTDQYIL